MAKILLLIALSLSLSAQAVCFIDTTGLMHCDNYAPPPSVDFRTDSNSPKIYENGEYRGNLNNNRYDPNSISNPYGRYGNPYSPDSVNNPYRIR